MQIQNLPKSNVPTYARPAAPQGPAQNPSSVNEDSVNLQSEPQTNRYAPAQILTRAVSGAVGGVVSNWLSGGSVGKAALIHGGIGAVVGGTVGAIGGLAVGGSAGSPVAGAVTGAVVVGGITGVTGAAKGAVTQVIVNALGGSPLVAAGVGAVLGAI